MPVNENNRGAKSLRWRHERAAWRLRHLVLVVGLSVLRHAPSKPARAAGLVAFKAAVVIAVTFLSLSCSLAFTLLAQNSALKAEGKARILVLAARSLLLALRLSQFRAVASRDRHCRCLSGSAHCSISIFASANVCFLFGTIVRESKKQGSERECMMKERLAERSAEKGRAKRSVVKLGRFE